MLIALYDEPMRLEDRGFNISAPHMHAQCLEALAIQPGMAVLDVGCGSGIIAACAAVLVRMHHFITIKGVPLSLGLLNFHRCNTSRTRTTTAFEQAWTGWIGRVQVDQCAPSLSACQMGRGQHVC